MGKQANLRVQVLGVLAVAVDGREVPPKELASRKGRTLLKLLLARRGEVVPADVLVEALWGGEPPADPDANLATLVSRLRSVLGAEVIAGDRHGWRFGAGPRVEVDLEEAQRLAGEAGARLAGEPALALAAAERALALLGRGPFLADEPDADWALPARREAERLTARARRLAWEAALAVGDPARALSHADAATTADPLDESAWRAVMAAHTAAGEPAAALAAFERLRHILAEELGTDPSPESQALHLAILRGPPAPPAPAPAPGGPAAASGATAGAAEGATAGTAGAAAASAARAAAASAAGAGAAGAAGAVDSREHASSGSATLPLRGAQPGPGSLKAAPGSGLVKAEPGAGSGKAAPGVGSGKAEPGSRSVKAASGAGSGRAATGARATRDAEAVADAGPGQAAPAMPEADPAMPEAAPGPAAPETSGSTGPGAPGPAAPETSGYAGPRAPDPAAPGAPGLARSTPVPGLASSAPVPGPTPSATAPDLTSSSEATVAAGASLRVSSSSAAEAGFVGREVELAELGRAWEGAVGGRPRLVLLVGEAGIGKTRLVGAAAELAAATGGLVVQARCYEAERSLFLQPLAEAVRAAALALPPGRVAAAAGDAAGTLAELVPELRRLLDLPAYERAPAELERRRSFEAVTAFVRGLAAQQPLLLAVDDLHQGGAATLELLHFLARRLAGDRLLLVATVRSEEGAEALAALADVGRVLELGPLPAAAVAELARRFGVADLAGPVLERARGHTLFTVESLRAAAEGGRDRAAVPASLRDAVLTRARRAGPEVETLLRAATVVGAAFDLEAVAGLLELPVEAAAGRAERALAARLLVEDDTGAGYRFANDLIREVLYQTSPRPTRVSRHRRLAAMLAGRPEAAAGHAAAAGDWAAAARAWMAAAAEAAASYANRDAERLLDRAVAAAERAGDPALEAAARLDRGRALVALGHYREAFADQEQALRLATAHGQDELEAAALEQLGWTAYYSRDHQAASELTPQARELAERAVAARRARPTALLLAARMRHAEGDLAGAREAFDAVLGEPDPATQTTGLTYLGLLLDHSDRFAEARQVLDRSIEACRAAGLFRPLLTSYFAATLACANLGDLRGALERLAVLERLLADVEDRFYHARAATTGSWLWRELGDQGRARALADRATELLGPAATGTHPGLHAQLALAECALLAGDHGRAAALLERAGGQLDRPFGYRWRVELRHAELTSRLDPPAAEALLELARTYGSTKYQALALARLGRRPEALELAAASGSDYLAAQVAPPAQARAAVDRIAAGLPPELRPAFLRHGFLARTVAEG